MRSILLGTIASILPHRYRERLIAESDLGLRTGALICSSLQIMGGFVNYGLGMMAYARWAKQADIGQDAIGVGPNVAFMWINYLLTPRAMLSIYCAVEGAVRLFAAVANLEALPTLPLAVVAWVHTAIEKKRHEVALGPLMPDKVTRVETGEWKIRIETCRPKEWTDLTTISYEDALYEVHDIEVRAGDRKYIYFLRPAPLSKVMRGFHHYAPDEVLKK